MSTFMLIHGACTGGWCWERVVPLLEAARRLELAPTDCIYVGDDERDIVAGLAAGMPTVAARYGYLGQKADNLSWGAHAHIDTPLELLKWLPRP